MANLKLRFLVVVVLLAVTAFMVNRLQYDVSSKKGDSDLANLQRIPLQIGDSWHGQDFPLEEMVYKILETRSIIHRSYATSKGESAFLSIVHYPDAKVDFHTPEACLGGQGLKTEKSNKTITLYYGKEEKTLNVAEIITTRDTDQSLTYYFFKAGSFVGSNYIKMRLNIAFNKLGRNDSKGSLVRVSTTLKPGNETEAKLQLKRFLEDIYPYLLKSL